jgi:hypothetical protein
MQIMRSQHPDSVGIAIDAISLSSLLRKMSRLPGLRVVDSKQNPLTDEASASFEFKGRTFRIHTPLSDYWIDRPDGCPAGVFEEISQHLETLQVHWWNRLF